MMPGGNAESLDRSPENSNQAGSGEEECMGSVSSQQ